MKKVVYFIDHLRADGTQTFLRLLVAGLAERGWRQAVMCLNESWDAELVAALKHASAEVRFLNRRQLVSGIGPLSTWLWLRQRRFDVAVTLLFHSDVIGRPLARLAGIPRVITSLRARNVHYTNWQRLLSRLTIGWADAVVINSSQFQDFAVTIEGVAPQCLVTIPNGVIFSPIAKLPAQDIAGITLPPNSRIIGAIGRLTYQKGFDILLHAVAALDRQHVEILIIGEGEQRSALEAQAGMLGIAEHVHFLGYRRDIPQILAVLDVYAHPARFEGMSNVVLEAMAAGCPIIATAVDGNRELIMSGEHGWLVEPEDPQAFAIALRAAIDHPDEAHRRGLSAQRRANQEFSLPAMIARWEDVLQGNRA